VEPTRQHDTALALDAIDESMLMIDAATPPACELMPQRLGLAYAGARVAFDRSHDRLDATELRPVVAPPVIELLARLGRVGCGAGA
jgi:hypothetical protein